MTTSANRKRFIKTVPPLTIILLVILIQFLGARFVAAPRERLDGLLYDMKVQHLPPWPESVLNIQIVDIDERSLATIGRMPWSRDKFAELTEKLAAAGAIVIAFDVLFAEPQVNEVKLRLEQSELPSGVDQDVLLSWAEQFNDDHYFAGVISHNEVVLPALLHREFNIASGAPLQTAALNINSVAQPDFTRQLSIPQFSGFAGTIKPLLSVASGQGYMNSFEDADGFIRRGALLSQVDGVVVPSFALETFRVYSLLSQVTPAWEVSEKEAYLTGVQVGDTLIPTDITGKILVPFKGPQKTYPYTSAADIFQGNFNPNRFDQAIVFIGTSAIGLADLRSTPVGLGYPGVEIQATLFDALAAPESIPSQPEWWREFLLLQLILIGAVYLWLLPGRPPLQSATLSLTIFVLVVALNLGAWQFYFLHLPLFSVGLLTLLLSGYYVINGFFAENKRRRVVKKLFDQYVPPAHIDKILSEPDAVNLIGEKKVLSVMFSDIRSFTTISESMEASELKRWLNRFFTPITSAILTHGGTIDKYVGDMVMAFWGAPLDEPAHAEKAIDAAFEMLSSLNRLNAAYLQDGLPQAAIGIGINTGDMNVGDMGSDFRRSYTVIGDAVNLGSRLEGLTKYYGVTILVSESTKLAAPKYDFWTIDKVKVKGKDLPVTVYSPVTPESPDDNAQAQAFNVAMESYFARQFNAAYKAFELLGDDFPNQTLRQLYLLRTRHFIAEPPSAEWDGSYTHTSK